MNNVNGIEILNKKDMELIIGGSISFPVEGRFLNKSVCLAEAKKLLDNGSVKNMTQQQVAEEIYSHAVLYLSGITVDALSNILGNYLTSFVARMVAEYLIEHSKTIDLTDGGDSFVRRLAYSIIWNVL